ncbi:MAG TPA: hypothetical protein VGD98_05855 [Ktedonobacteraceae bacterium]
MAEIPGSKRIKAVTGHAMLNFVHWVHLCRPEIANLRTLSRTDLLQLVYAFEQNRPDIEPRSADIWLQSIEDLNRGEAMYREAREVFTRKR